MALGFARAPVLRPQTLGALETGEELLELAQDVLLFLDVEEEDAAGFFCFGRWEAEVSVEEGRGWG